MRDSSVCEYLSSLMVTTSVLQLETNGLVSQCSSADELVVNISLEAKINNRVRTIPLQRPIPDAIAPPPHPRNNTDTGCDVIFSSQCHLDMFPDKSSITVRV